MHAITVLDKEALAAFRAEHPWLDLPEKVVEITIYFSVDGGPRSMAALQAAKDGKQSAFDIDSLGAECILALVAYAPHGVTVQPEKPKLGPIWRILESLPRVTKSGEAERVEADRRALLDDAFGRLRDIALQQIEDKRTKAASPAEVYRLTEVAAALPTTLDGVADEQMPAWAQLDLWGVVAVLRDELSLPADQDLTAHEEASFFSRDTLAKAAATAMSGPIVQAMFDLSPCALSLSTLGGTQSHYIRVNQSYLDLVGRNWDQLREHEMLSTGVVTADEARRRRLHLLDTEGGYVNEPAKIFHASGKEIAVTISARRISIAGQLFDFEIITPQR